MGFDEKKFVCLVADTRQKVVAFGTTSKSVLRSHKRYTNHLYEFLKRNVSSFYFHICQNAIYHQASCLVSQTQTAGIPCNPFIEKVSPPCENKAARIDLAVGLC